MGLAERWIFRKHDAPHSTMPAHEPQPFRDHLLGFNYGLVILALLLYVCAALLVVALHVFSPSGLWLPPTMLAISTMLVVGTVLLAYALLKHVSLEKLEERRLIISAEINSAQRAFENHKLSRMELERFLELKYAELFRITARIEEALAEHTERFQEGLSGRQRWLMRRLNHEKRLLLRERRLLEEAHLKHKIPPPVFENLLSQNTAQLRRIDASIERVYKSQLVRAILGELKEKLAKSSVRKLRRKWAERRAKRKMLEEMAEALIRQAEEGLSKQEVSELASGVENVSEDVNTHAEQPTVGQEVPSAPSRQAKKFRSKAKQRVKSKKARRPITPGSQQ
jgi:hypothetical protein